MSRDPITGEVKAEPVAQVFTHPASNLVTVTLSDGQTLTCTPTHPFYVPGKGFVPAGELTAGEKLVSGAEAQGGTGATAVSVSHVAWRKETAGAGTPGAGTTGAQTLVYNLGVASTHTYFVGTQNDGVWVHNECEDEVPLVPKRGYGNSPEYKQALDKLRGDAVSDFEATDRESARQFAEDGGLKPEPTYEEPPSDGTYQMHPAELNVEGRDPKYEEWPHVKYYFNKGIRGHIFYPPTPTAF